MTSPNEARLMTMAEVATYLHVPVGTIKRWRRYGEGPSGFKVGKHVRYRRSEVDTWLEAQRDQPRQPWVSGYRSDL